MSPKGPLFIIGPPLRPPCPSRSPLVQCPNAPWCILWTAAGNVHIGCGHCRSPYGAASPGPSTGHLPKSGKYVFWGWECGCKWVSAAPCLRSMTVEEPQSVQCAQSHKRSKLHVTDLRRQAKDCSKILWRGGTGSKFQAGAGLPGGYSTCMVIPPPLRLGLQFWPISHFL